MLIFTGPEARALSSGGERISLAGTFNQWAASDDAYRLAKVGDRYELIRFWPCGTAEFKFVFNGSWDRHLGDAGDGKLTQPGRNIQLRICESGEYAIWLDLGKNRWGLEKRAASGPHAIILVHDAHGGKVLLDGSASISRQGHPLTSYQWLVRSLSPAGPTEEGDRTWEPAASSKTTFNAYKPGPYQIQLTVSDGVLSDRATTTRDLHHGWRMSYSTESKSQPNQEGLMLPFGSGAWGWVFNALRDGDGFLIKERVVRSDPRRTLGESIGTCRVPTHKGRRYLAKIATETGVFSLHPDGWHEFRLPSQGVDRLPEDLIVENVHLVGDFNSWQPRATPMHDTADGAVFATILELPDGVHHYKFLVNGCIWLEDAAADPRFRKPDGTGGFNSGVLIGPDTSKLGPAQVNHINPEALKHDLFQGAYFTPISENLVRLTLRTLADDVEAVAVLPLKEGVFYGDGAAPIAMHRAETRAGFDYWKVQVRVKDRMMPFAYESCGGPVSGKMSVMPVIDYVFLISDGWVRLILGKQGATTMVFAKGVRMAFETPDWAKTAVWYQIFPERFCNADPTNDPPGTVPWSHEWYERYEKKKSKSRKVKTSKSRDAQREEDDHSGSGDYVERGDFYEFIYDRRYGGDIRGIREKLPYLRDLGINAIYLNPVFQAASLHKYDAGDFRHIDDHFGVKDSLKKISGETEDPATWQWSESDRLFLDFLQEAHRLGFKVIIDGVFNHTGREFWAFRDILENKEKSPYADWFDIKSWDPFHYAGWDREDGMLPRLKHDDKLGLSEPVRQHIFAITRRWMDPNGDGDPSDGIDGWRLDVASDIDASFWRDWRKLVKSINPDAYIVAELWEESRKWLTGDTFDAVMNYPFARSCQRFFVNRKKAIKPAEFARQLEEVLGWYPDQVNYVQQNLFASHDTDRVASMFMNPDLEYDKANRLQDNGPNYNPAKPTPDCYQRLAAMVTVQMTFLGAPMIYYGDEVGMYGADDPSCRKPMLWPDLLPYDDPDERIEQGVYDHHRRMIAIRNTYPALQLGTFEVLLAEQSRGIFAFSRTLENETIVVVVNNSNRPRKLDIPVNWPAGARVIRLDDPAACEVVDPPKDDAKARPLVRPVADHPSGLKIEDGHLRGLTLPPRSSGVFGGSY